MRQPTQRLAQRRSDAQAAGAFTFWFRRPHTAKHIGAWMLTRGAEEAAFLTIVGEAPRLGEQLELTGSDNAGLSVTEPPSGSGARLPRFGRVVGLDDPEGMTRRVAIRFEKQPRSTPV